MIALSLKQLAAITHGSLTGDNLTVNTVTTDTRQISTGSLFIALQGERFDAHDFVNDAIAQGAVALLVSKHLPLATAQIVVKDTRLALGQLAGWVRQQSPARVLALTGSSGKTSVKEMAAAILGICGATLCTAGNLNNDIGVPLTLLRLTPEHRYAVIELGANHQGEIAYTTAMTRPETALVNNLAASHLEGFGSLAGVAKAKGEIFTGLSANDRAIINADSHDWLHWQPLLRHQRVWRFSLAPQSDSDFWVSNIQITLHGTLFTLHTPHGAINITLPLLGRHNIANALAAAALALSADAPLSAIQQGLATVKPVPGRLFPVAFNAAQLLLDDSYNANVGSMIAAVQVLADMPRYRVLVVGDMAELGDDSIECHRQVGIVVQQAQIDKVLSIGTLSKHISDASGVGEHFQQKTRLMERLSTLLAQHQQITILIKGSRRAAMEQVVQRLQEKGIC